MSQAIEKGKTLPRKRGRWERNGEFLSFACVEEQTTKGLEGIDSSYLSWAKVLLHLLVKLNGRGSVGNNEVREEETQRRTRLEKWETETKEWKRELTSFFFSSQNQPRQFTQTQKTSNSRVLPGFVVGVVIVGDGAGADGSRLLVVGTSDESGFGGGEDGGVIVLVRKQTRSARLLRGR